MSLWFTLTTWWLFEGIFDFLRLMRIIPQYTTSVNHCKLITFNVGTVPDCTWKSHQAGDIRGEVYSKLTSPNWLKLEAKWTKFQATVLKRDMQRCGRYARCRVPVLKMNGKGKRGWRQLMLSANLQPIQPVVGKHHSCSAFIVAAALVTCCFWGSCGP